MSTTNVTERLFDTVIVGAGPAGCVLASRLSEQREKHILLVEAGPDIDPIQQHPDVLDPFPISVANPRYHWPGLSAETGADRGNGNGRITSAYLQGYGVGGASNINGMGADRGQPTDYDEWHSLGAEGWNWEGVLPYFRKLERVVDLSDRDDLSAHGNDGPIPVRRLARSNWGPFAAAIGTALERRGLPFLENYNTDFREGFGAAPTNSLLEGRVSTSMAYLTREVRSRSNLTILPHVMVDKLSLDGLVANGVFAQVDGAVKQIRAREVIASGGAIQSPALLLRSGIGPREHLESRGVPLALNLRGVGSNLQNHPYVLLATYLPPTSRQPPDNPWLLQNWLRFSSRYPGCHDNDMHLMPFNKCDWHALGSRIGAVAIAVFKSYSKGRVELLSPSPRVAPRVQFNLLADPRDLERLVSGLRFALEILADPTVESVRQQVFYPDDRYVAALSRRTGWNGFRAAVLASVLDQAGLRGMLLGKAVVDPRSLLANDAALREFVLERAQPEYHVCGTCCMGRPGDPETVVDSQGRVQGITALRVVDASIFPTVPRANTHLSVIMAAEKIADAIKAQWRHER